ACRIGEHGSHAIWSMSSARWHIRPIPTRSRIRCPQPPKSPAIIRSGPASAPTASRRRRSRTTSRRRGGSAPAASSCFHTTASPIRHADPTTSHASRALPSSSRARMGFSALDYAVLAAYLVGITWFGSRFRKSHRSVQDYFVGKRQTSWIVISLSIVATETSTLTPMGVPALAYRVYARPELGGSYTYLQVVAGYIVARFVISWLFIPAYFQGNMLTAYELLNRRFGPTAKHFAASLF